MVLTAWNSTTWRKVWPAVSPSDAPGLDLALAHGFEAGPQDFGAIGAEIDRQRDQRGGVGAEPDARAQGRPKKTMKSCTSSGVLRIAST